MEHAALLSQRLRDLGAEPFDYKPLPAQIAMFNAMEGLNETCERIAGFSLAGETVANYLIQICLKSPDVPEWIKQPYRRITEDEAGHGSVPQQFLRRYAITEERQERAVAPSPCAWSYSANTLPAWIAGRWARIAGRQKLSSLLTGQTDSLGGSMKLLFFDDFKLGVLKGDNVVDVSAVVRDIRTPVRII